MRTALVNQPTRRLGATLAHESVPERCSSAKGMPLGPFEGLLVAKVDGRRTIADLAALFSITPLEISTVVARLVELGALRTRVDTHELGVEIEHGDIVEIAELDGAWDAADPPSSIPVPASRRLTNPTG